MTAAARTRGLAPARAAWLAVGAILAAIAANNAVAGIQEVLKGNFAHDYRYYFSAVRIGTSAGWGRIYSLQLQQQEWARHWQDGFNFTPFINPPPVAWLSAPVGVLPWTSARLVWTVGEGLLLLGIVLLAAPPSWRHRLGYGLLALAFTPVLGAVRDGQVTLLVVLGIVAGIRLMDSGHEVLAGCAFSLIGVKPHLAVMVPVALAVTGHWRTLVAFAGVTAAWLAASLAVVGAAGVHDYTGLLQWASIFQTPKRRSLMWLAGGGPASAALEVAAVAGVVGTLVALRRRPLGLVMSVAIVGSLICAPYINYGDFSLLLVPLWLVFDGRWSRLALVAAALIVAVQFLELWPRLVPPVEVLALAGLVLFGRGRGARDPAGDPALDPWIPA